MSLHPFVKDADAIFDEALLGAWDFPQGDGYLVFERDGDKKYRLAIHEKEKVTRYEGRLVAFGDTRCLDFQAVPAQPEPYLVLRAHGLMRVAVVDGALEISLLDYRSLRDAWEKGGHKLEGLAASDSPGGLLLTSSTDELRAFILANLKQPNLFDKPARNPRRKAPK